MKLWMTGALFHCSQSLCKEKGRVVEFRLVAVFDVPDGGEDGLGEGPVDGARVVQVK